MNKRSMVHALDLTVVLVGRELRVQYGNALLGVFWAPFASLVQVAVLSFLFLRVVPLDVPDYPVFVFTGVMAWQLMLTAMLSGVESFTNNRDLVSRPGFPVGLLPLVSIAGALTAYLLSFPVLIAFLAATGRLHATVLVTPFVLVALVAVVVGPVLVTASFNVRYRDVHHIVATVLGVLFYLTPVFYDVDRIPERFRWIVDVNPLALAVRLHRQILYDGDLPDARMYLACLAIGAVGLVAGRRVFERAEPQLADDL